MTHPAPDRLFLDFQSAVAGRYSLERELGRGGMGVVYLAREVRLDRPVAIKLLPPSKATDPKLRERFLREARTAAKLSHPNVIPIHAVEEIGGFVFFAMAYIEGETLTERVRQRGPLPPSEASRMLRDVAWALAYAHGQGVIHRDVKPDNILLENGGRVLVADFGIASVVAGAGALATGGVLLYPFAMLFATPIAAYITGSPAFGFFTLVSGYTLVPLGVLVNRARRLLNAGFAHGDIGVAFKAEIERSREERAYGLGHGGGPSLFEKVLRWISATGLGAAALALSGLVVWAPPWAETDLLI